MQSIITKIDSNIKRYWLMAMLLVGGGFSANALQEHYEGGQPPCSALRSTLNASYTYSNVSGVIFNFTDTSTGAPDGWTWEMGDGSILYSQNPGYGYAQTGILNTCLTITKAGFNPSTTCQLILVCEDPKAVSDTLDICNGAADTLNVLLNDDFIGTATTTIHSAPANGTLTFSTDGIAIYTPNSSFVGQDTATYILTDTCGMDTSFIYFNVEGSPTAVWTYTTTFGSTTVNFTNNSTGSINAFYWDYGDGTINWFSNPAHSYPMPGAYSVCLYVFGDCGPDTLCQDILVCLDPIATNDTMTICDGLTDTMNVLLNDFYTGNATTTLLYSPSNGTFSLSSDGEAIYNPNSGFIGLDSVAYKLTDTCGMNIAKIYFIVEEPPVSNWTYNINPPGSTTVDFTYLASSNVDYFLWYYGDYIGSFAQNPSHTYSSYGTYTAFLTVYNECGADTLTQIITLECPEPTANIDTLAVCYDSSHCINLLANDLYTPAASVSIISGPAHGYVSAFDPITGDICFNPSSGYTGQDEIIYELTDTCGVDTSKLILLIGTPPVANYTVTGGGLNLYFWDASTGNPDTWEWKVDGITQATTQNYAHTFPGPGVYQVCLIVANACGSDTLCMPQIDCAPPICNTDNINSCDTVITFNVLDNDNYVAPDTVTITTLPTNGTITALNSSTGEITYETNYSNNPIVDSFQYCLADPFGVCYSWVHIIVDPKPKADFTYTYTGGTTVVFNSTSLGGPFNSWLWDFGDGNTNNTHFGPGHTYASGGTYNVCLTVENNCDFDTFCQAITIQCFDPITVNDTISVCTDTAYFNVYLNDNYTNPVNGSILVYPSNGSVMLDSPSGNVTYIPNAGFTGTDSFQYKINDPCGHSTAWVFINVMEPPMAAFTFSQVLLTFSFTDISTGNPTSWFWDFGDGNTSTLQNPIHTYTTGATYVVCLTASNDCGNSNHCEMVTDCGPPVALFDYLEMCDDTTIYYDVMQNDTFFNPGTVTILTPPTQGTATLNSSTGQLCYMTNAGFTGIDSLTYILTDLFGADTTTVGICRATTPNANFTYASFGLTTNFNNNSAGAPIDFFMWDFGDGNIDSTNFNSSHTYAAYGTYNVCLWVANKCGLDSICKNVIIECLPPIAEHDSLLLCKNTSITQDLSINDSWTGTPSFSIFTPPLNGGAILNPVTGIVTYTPFPGFTGSDGFWYKLEDNCGWDTVKICVDILPLPTADFNYTPFGLTVTFNNNSLDSDSWAWDFGDATNSALENPTHTYATVGTYTVCLIANNFCGSDTTCQNIEIEDTNCSPPDAVYDTLELCEPGSIIAFNILLNDSYGTGHQATLISGPYNGTIVSWNWFLGSVTYQAGAVPFLGDSLQYELKDDCNLDTAWVYINCSSPLATPVITTSITVMLEGPYDSGTGLMGGDLNNAGQLPNIEPYGSLTSGTFVQATTTGVLGTLGNNQPIDWVCVQLRDKNNPSIVVASKAGLLQKDGNIVAGNGGNFQWYGVSPDDYYIIIYHRTHLPISSAAPIYLDDSATNDINFSDGSTAAYGTNPMFNINGTLVLICGDSNGDGTINAFDRSAWFPMNGQPANYNSEDFNCDSQINAADNAIWFGNNSHQAQLPFTW